MVSTGIRRKIMLLGSSMVERSFSLEYQGWGAALANWYARSADILNRGAGGYNSRWLKRYLPDMMGENRPDITVLFIGNNDAIQEGEPQHVPLAEYKANILDILGHLHRVNESMAVLLISTTRVNEQLRPLQRNIQRSRYAEVLRFIYRNRSRPEILGTSAIPQQLAFVELWGGSNCSDPDRAAQLERYSITPEDLHDGAHLNVAGNKKLFSALRDTINEQFPHLSPDFARPVTVPRVRRSNSVDLQLEGSNATVTVLGKRPPGSPRSQHAHKHVTGSQRAENHSNADAFNEDRDDQEEVVRLKWTVPSWRTLS